LVSAFAAARALTTLVYGVRPTDPVALGIAVGVLAAIALAASAVPVRCALRVDRRITSSVRKLRRRERGSIS
jgi:hypothetical protein